MIALDVVLMALLQLNTSVIYEPSLSFRRGVESLGELEGALEQ